MKKRKSFLAYCIAQYKVMPNKFHIANGQQVIKHLIIRPSPDIMRSDKNPLRSLCQCKIHKGVQADLPANCILKMKQEIRKLFKWSSFTFQQHHTFSGYLAIPIDHITWTYHKHIKLIHCSEWGFCHLMKSQCKA